MKYNITTTLYYLLSPILSNVSRTVFRAVFVLVLKPERECARHPGKEGKEGPPNGGSDESIEDQSTDAMEVASNVA